MRFCFVAASSWFTNTSAGGAEKQVYNITTALAKKNHQVDLYVADLDQIRTIQDVRLIPAWDNSKGCRLIRYFTYRIPTLVSKILAGEYDMVYMRGYSDFSMNLVKALKGRNTISAIALASDTNISWEKWKESFPARKKWTDPICWIRKRIFTEYTLKNVDVILTQNQYQTRYANVNRMYAKYIPNIYKIDNTKNEIRLPQTDIAWIGGLRPEKGVNELFTIIDRFPNAKFIVVGSARENEQEQIEKEFSRRNNVEYKKHVDNKYVSAILKNTKILLNTSPNEGFSNTFLEAWYNETPVFSLSANPSGLLNSEDFGFCANSDIEMLLLKMKERVEDSNGLGARASIAREYVEKYHNEDLVVREIEIMIEEIRMNTNSKRGTSAYGI